MPVSVKPTPKFLENNPSAQKDWDIFKRLSDERKIANELKKSAPKSEKKDIGPDIPCFSNHLVGWRRTDSEWTDQSVTGTETTFDDYGFSFHVAGMRIHAYAGNYTQIFIDDGSIPLQFYNSYNSTGYDDYTLSTVSQKFMATWMYTPESLVDGHGNNSWGPDFSKCVVCILEQDPNSNVAIKTRLDFYRSYSGSSELSVQVIIEHKNMGSYIETNVRYNLSDREILYITNGDLRTNGNGAGTLIELWAPRNLNEQTVQSYDSSQVHTWWYTNTYDEVSNWDDYSTSYNFFEGITLSRRVPITALDASDFFSRTVLTSVPSKPIIKDNKTRDTWILAIGVTVGVLLLLQILSMFRRSNAALMA